MNRITSLFQKKNEKVLNVYFTAGFPKLKDTVSVLEALQAVDHHGARGRGLEILQDNVEQGGANYSVGQFH